MPRQLPDDIQAYNACVGVINSRDEQIDTLLAERDRAWKACEALFPTARHAARGPRVKLIKVPKAARR